MTNEDRKAALQLLAEERVGKSVRAAQLEEEARIAASSDRLRRAGLVSG